MHARLYLACVAMVLLMTCAAAAGDGANESSPSESLRKAVISWQKDMFSEDAAVRLATLDAMWPNAEDVAVLFPDHADKLGQLLEAGRKQAKKRLKFALAEVLARERERHRSIRSVETIDVRSDDRSRSHEKVLKLIPQDVPVYRVVIRYEKGVAGSSSYLYVNDHWIHFQGFTSIPEILPKLDELLEQASNAG